MDRKMVDFIKEQYPPGTRIRLNSMEDPYAPIAPGTEGEVDFVDDIGTIHMKWDNGRALGIVPGEDSFSVLPPKLTTLKLYMPLTADFYERSEYRDLEPESTELDGHALQDYQDQIMAELVKNRMPEETERGLMHWYHEADSVNTKVHSAVFTVEERDRKLWGVAECRIAGELSTAELDTLKEYIAGQASDGWGEHFEQREILVDGGSELYVHLWNADDWGIQTEQERFAPKLAEGLPELCFSVLPSTGELICIKRGENGYYPSDRSTDDPAQNRELADYNNERLGVTQAQRLAMECGSMHGWDVPGADPSAYQQNEPQMGGMNLGYREAYQKLGLFGPEHCVGDRAEQDYIGKVLVLSPDTLKESCWSQENQLWYAHDGFGCSPHAIGRSVRCTCLSDGEMTRWNRDEFVGVLDEKFLPDWAKESLSQFQQEEAAESPGMNNQSM